jgi:ribonucleoside-diphosphate reductase alpha chain
MVPDAAPFSPYALRVLRERYLRREADGRVVEDAEQMLVRVAGAVAAAAADFGEDRAEWESRFAGRMQRLEFLPNSPALMNAGLPGGQLAACFVLPIEDDLDSIFAALSRMARIHQSGGGTGFSFSRLRPRADHVRSTGGVTSGPLSFMDLFDRTTAVIREGGRRRGANMAVLRVDHPDIREFVDAKRTPGRLENFNLSVGITDAFLDAVDAGAGFPLVNPRSGKVTAQTDARALFESMVQAAWETGDPGLLFLDEINRHNPTPNLGSMEATNPCGEQPLLAYESCVLGSLNLAAFVDGATLAWNRFGEAIRDAIVFLDNVLEVTSYPIPEIARATRRTRKIGLGVMGLADLLAHLEIPYDSETGLDLGERIAAFLATRARSTSAELGQRRGSFPAFADSVWPGRGYPALRNATTTCVAPTGTISLFAGVSSGIEPFYALAVARHALDDTWSVEVHPQVADAVCALGTPSAGLLDVLRDTGTLPAGPPIPDALRRRFPIALEIAPAMHVAMQAAFQRHVDAAVSKTVNLPVDAPPDAVREVFRLARTLRLKGVTVYRYGSRPEQTLSLVHDVRGLECRECAV